MMERAIEVSTSTRAGFAQVREVLSDDPGAVFRDGAMTEAHQDAPTRTVLGVDLGAGASVHQEVLLRLGVGQSTERGLVVPVAWRATGRERLFPTFTGELEASQARNGTWLRLHGTYTVPLGVIGRIGDGVGGWRLARRSLDELLARLGRQLETDVDWRRRSASGSTPDAVAPAGERSEIYIG
jgi:hypothetical protein